MSDVWTSPGNRHMPIPSVGRPSQEFGVGTAIRTSMTPKTWWHDATSWGRGPSRRAPEAATGPAALIDARHAGAAAPS